MLALYLAALETGEERDKLACLYEKYNGLFMRVALNMLHSKTRAEDAVSATFVSAIEHKEKILSKTPIDFCRWGVLVVERHCIDILRRNKHYDGGVSLNGDNAPELAADADNNPLELRLTKKEDFERLAACVAKLDPVNRQILRMKCMYGMSYNEISRELNMTAAQVNSRLERARNKIRKEMRVDE